MKSTITLYSNSVFSLVTLLTTSAFVFAIHSTKINDSEPTSSAVLVEKSALLCVKQTSEAKRKLQCGFCVSGKVKTIVFIWGPTRSRRENNVNQPCISYVNSLN